MFIRRSRAGRIPVLLRCGTPPAHLVTTRPEKIRIADNPEVNEECAFANTHPSFREQVGPLSAQ
jgi:hypothetical protein